MTQYIIKLFITSIIIVVATEISKKSTVLAAIIIALPLVSLLTFSWIYLESKDVLKIARLSTEILYFGLATVPLFLILPFMLKGGYSFLLSMILSCLSSAITMLLVKMYLLND
ncbi:DUF3147 family protein [bacterium]|nr:DUF3147 family protein [bacterium]|tara:strand:- start:69014 stop:69352 length:339 start_codon:yes stop_codon:yes gene_type:complete